MNTVRVISYENFTKGPRLLDFLAVRYSPYMVIKFIAETRKVLIDKHSFVCDRMFQILTTFKNFMLNKRIGKSDNNLTMTRAFCRISLLLFLYGWTYTRCDLSISDSS